jgi:hypothetical protein
MGNNKHNCNKIKIGMLIFKIFKKLNQHPNHNKTNNIH